MNDRRASLADADKEVQGKVNPPLLATIFAKMEMGGQLWAQQFADGFPVIGNIGEQGVYQIDKSCRQPDLGSDQLFGNAKNRIQARMSGPIRPGATQLWEEAADQVEKGWSGGPFPSEDMGRLLTEEGLREVNPAVRFGAQQGGNLRAVDDLMSGRTNVAAAIYTPATLPTWDHFGAVIRMFREGQTK